MADYFLDVTYKIDELAVIMAVLISYIGVCVIGFASRYMEGDTNYRPFFIYVLLLICSVAIMVCSDHLGVLFLTSCLSNFILVRLMIHKSRWKAAHASGMIAGKNYILSAICMALAFTILYFSTHSTSINYIIHQNNPSNILPLALVLLLVAAMRQSAIWPFHKWLIGSLNSPTPVSAIMHAGLINGGGFLLVRFAPLYLQYPQIMTGIFFIGMVTAVLGTLWKLMQSDVKKMLACSTMGQMGFMFAQCGLGLFPLAIVHLFWHGMFKACLFLASGSAAQEKRFDLSYPPKALTFLYAFVSGTVASIVFGYVSNKSWFAGDSTLVLMVIVSLAGTQLALPILHIPRFRNFLLASIVTITAALIYGASTYCIIWILQPMELMQAQPLNMIHIVAIISLIFTWISMFFVTSLSKFVISYPSWMLKSYVKTLNASQPHPDTMTAHHNHYQYL